MAAWRAGFIPTPAVNTWPRITSSINSGFIPVFFNRPAMTFAPSCAAGISESIPPKLPTGVRPAATITTLLDIKFSPPRKHRGAWYFLVLRCTAQIIERWYQNLSGDSSSSVFMADNGILNQYIIRLEWADGLIFLYPFLPVRYGLELLRNEIHKGPSLGREVPSMDIDGIDYQRLRLILFEYRLQTAGLNIQADDIGGWLDQTAL